MCRHRGIIISVSPPHTLTGYHWGFMANERVDAITGLQPNSLPGKNQTIIIKKRPKCCYTWTAILWCELSWAKPLLLQTLEWDCRANIYTLLHGSKTQLPLLKPKSLLLTYWSMFAGTKTMFNYTEIHRVLETGKTHHIVRRCTNHRSWERKKCYFPQHLKAFSYLPRNTLEFKC